MNTNANRYTQSKVLTFLAYTAIYVIWGSTYLAIRYSVETLPPFLMMGSRSFLAGSLLMAWARFRGAGRPTAEHWRSAFVLGVLFFVGGHGALAWGAERVPSGVAALVMASVPVWTAILQAAVHRIEGSLWRVTLGLTLGLAGVAVLAEPGELLGGVPIDGLGVLVLQIGALSWSVGSVYALKAALPRSSTLLAGMSLTTGGALLIVLSLASGETFDVAAISTRSMVALSYLVVFGSIFAFGAYTWLLTQTSPIRVSTCAFVNPVIAVFLGWLLGGEALDARVLAATLLMVVGVAAIVTRSRIRKVDEAKEVSMIARVWRGRTPENKAEDYMDYLRKTGVKDHGAIPGNRGDYIWKRVDNGVAEFWVVSLWDSIDAIRKFAGPKEDEAIYYPEDKEYLLELDPHVDHYEILHAPERFGEERAD